MRRKGSAAKCHGKGRKEFLADFRSQLLHVTVLLNQ